MKTADAAAKKPRTAKKNDIAFTYNQFKEFEGRKYTGMAIGRSHKSRSGTS